MKKTLKILLYGVSVVLIFALAVVPCICFVASDFSDDGNLSNSVFPSVSVGINDNNSFVPLKEQNIFTDITVNLSPDVELLDTANKNLLSLNAIVNGVKEPVFKEDVKDNPIATPEPLPGVTDKPEKPIVITDKYALLTQPDGSQFVYYEQTWDAYTDYPYGYDHVGSHGCGPTSMAMVISNLTGQKVSPTYMADWSVEHGYYVRGRGTAYGLFPAASKKFGIECTTISRDNKEAVVKALKEGKYLITVVRKGDFTNGRHFLLIRGITEDGKLLLGDSGKYENSLVEWDYDRVLRQVAQDKFWVFG